MDRHKDKTDMQTDKQIDGQSNRQIYSFLAFMLRLERLFKGAFQG